MGVRNEEEWCSVIRTALLYQKNIVIARHFEKLDHDLIRERARVSRAGDGGNGDQSYQGVSNPGHGPTGKMSIDIWSTTEQTVMTEYAGDENEIQSACPWDAIEGLLSLQIQLAFGLHRTGIWKHDTVLRVVLAVIINENHVTSSVETSTSGGEFGSFGLTHPLVGGGGMSGERAGDSVNPFYNASVRQQLYEADVRLRELLKKVRVTAKTVCPVISQE